jgi:hypothetical protein
MQYLEEKMNEHTKTVLLNRVYILDRDINWNTESIASAEQAIDAQKGVLAKLKFERAGLVEDLKEAGVELDVPVQS